MEFERTLTQILNDAKERSKVSGFDSNGNTVWTVDPDLYAQNIQALLDDPDYALSERKALAQAYKESTGKTLTIKSDNELIYSGIPDGIKRRAANQPSAYDLQKYVLNLLDAGTLDEKQAEALLGKHGALDDDIVD